MSFEQSGDPALLSGIYPESPSDEGSHRRSFREESSNKPADDSSPLSPSPEEIEAFSRDTWDGQQEAEEGEGDDDQPSKCARFFYNCDEIKGVILFGLDVIAFVYAIYGSVLLFAIMMMWVFSVLVSIYVSMSSGTFWAQFYAVCLGLPAIGALITFVDSSMMIMIRVLQLGFNSALRSYIFQVLVTPTTSAIDPTRNTPRKPNNPLDSLFVTFGNTLQWIPPRSLSPQAKLTIVFIIVDFALCVQYLAQNSISGMVAHSYVTIGLMLIAAIARLVQNLPTTHRYTDYKRRLYESRGVVFLKYATCSASLFILASVSLSSFFSTRPSVYRFTLPVLAILVCALAAVYEVAHDVYPRVREKFWYYRVSKGGGGGGGRSDDSNAETRSYHQPSKSQSNAVLVITVFVIWFLLFIAAAILRAASVGDYDDGKVTTKNRVCAIVVWLVLCIGALINTLGDWDSNDALERRDSTARNLPAANNNIDTSYYFNGDDGGSGNDAEHHWAVSHTEREYAAQNELYKNAVDSHTSKSRVGFCVVVMMSLVLLCVGLLTCISATMPSAKPARYYDFSVFNRSEDTKDPYPLCGMKWDRFNATDLVLIASIAYYNDAKDINISLGNYFDYPYEVALKPDVFSNLHAHHIIFNETTTAGGNSVLPEVDVIAIRGSLTGMDWLQDGYVWGDSLFFSFFNHMTPFSLPDSVIESFVDFSKWLRYGVFGDISYFTDLHRFTQQVTAEAAPRNGTVLLVGHSLGGGLAQLAGSSLSQNAFAVSGVGVGYQADAADFAVSSARPYLTNIKPDSDIVPDIDLQIGDINNIDCEVAPSPLGCHSVSETYNQLRTSCRDPRRQPDDAMGTPTTTIADAILQLLLWILLLVGTVVVYRVYQVVPYRKKDVSN